MLPVILSRILFLDLTVLPPFTINHSQEQRPVTGLEYKQQCKEKETYVKQESRHIHPACARLCFLRCGESDSNQSVLRKLSQSWRESTSSTGHGLDQKDIDTVDLTSSSNRYTAYPICNSPRCCCRLPWKVRLLLVRSLTYFWLSASQVANCE